MNPYDNTEEICDFIFLFYFFLISLILSGKLVTIKTTDAETRNAQV